MTEEYSPFDLKEFADRNGKYEDVLKGDDSREVTIYFDSLMERCSLATYIDLGGELVWDGALYWISQVKSVKYQSLEEKPSSLLLLKFSTKASYEVVLVLKKV